MNDLLQTAYHDVLKGAILSEEQMRGVVNELMDGLSDPYQTAGFLSVLASRGESVSEIAGAARVMREKCTPIRESGAGLLDTCGTGGDGLHTFNISTAAAILCASSGMSVAKHGNRSVSSTSGSADVLEQLGVAITLTPEQVDQCIEAVQIGFCFAPLLHQAMKHVVPIRKALKTRTIFNMLGPLTNPA
ncbi:MAG TPA: anthranilate phosphoribosyltransferase, partial [Planctomycetaceae bacterium]|nr:anthranilate phosphoribosyltransferase [Planctomycetaceae bacterium]